MAIIKVKEIKQNRNKTEDEQTKLMKPKLFFWRAQSNEILLTKLIEWKKEKR